MIKKCLKDSDFFRTSDLSLASVLSMFYTLEALDRQQADAKAYFLFQKDDLMNGIIERYWRRELTVEPISFFEAIKRIKARLYE